MKTIMANGLGILLWMTASCALASVEHISIHSKQFSLGQHPQIQVNIVSDNKAMNRLAFFVVQAQGEEKLMVHEANDFKVSLVGVEDVTDPNALLLVREYQIEHWSEVASIALFTVAEVQQAVKASNRLANKNSGHKVNVKGAADGLNSQGAATLSMASMASMASGANSTNSPLSFSSSNSSNLTNGTNGTNATNSAQPACLLVSDGTLWSIATRYAVSQQTHVYAAVLAIYEANPSAFVRGQLSQLRADADLSCPKAELLAKYQDVSAARAQFELMN